MEGEVEGDNEDAIKIQDATIVMNLATWRGNTLLPRMPCCSHCQLNNHMIEDYHDLIVKWETRTRQRTMNLVNSNLEVTKNWISPQSTLLLEEEHTWDLAPLKGISLRFR